MEPSSSKKSRFCKQERKRPKLNNGFGTRAELSTLTRMAATVSVAPSTQTEAEIKTYTKTKMNISPLSPSTSAPSTSSIIRLSTPAPSIPIPEIHDWTHSRVTSGETASFLMWAISTGSKMADPDDCTRLLSWASSKSELVAQSDPEGRGKRFVKWSRSISKMGDPNEPRRKVLKWARSTSTIRAPDERRRWSLQEEISKPFETALKRLQEENSSTDLKQEHMLYTCQKGMHGVYECQNALWIWPRIRNSPTSTMNGGPREVGKKIKENFPESDMIKGRPSSDDLGFVTIELSGKWIAKSIHKMLKAGIDTWAPKLPVERVIVDYPSLDEEIHVDLFRRRAIEYTLTSILEYSKVDVTIGHNTILTTRSKRRRAQETLNRWFSNEEKDQRDFDNAYKDLLALWYGQQRADWIVYLTPAWNQDYIEMCFTAAKLEKCVTSNEHNPARTSYAGYRACTIGLGDELLDEVKTIMGEGKDAKLLGYTPEALLDCVFTYAYLRTHRLAECKFDNNEICRIVGKKFLYLLYIRAQICRLTHQFCEDIDELKKASQLIFEDEGWEEGVERMLGFHLLKFTEVLEESCLSVLPHILCEYLYDLSKKFASYYDSLVYEVGFVRETCALLCEATAVVMDKCFHLLGINPTSSAIKLSVTPLPLRSPFTGAKRAMDVTSRDRPRNSRFELLSFCATTATDYEAADENSGLFGLISVSDKYGLPSDKYGSHFFEPDFAHVPLFNREWCNPINPTDSGHVYLGHPSVSFSSSVELRMELYVNKNKNVCYQLCNHKIEIDLSDFWDKTSDSACGALSVKGEDGSTNLYYILLKDAIDAALEMQFVTKTRGRQVRGYVLAYHGDDFLYECQCLPSRRNNYMALLFRPNNILEAGKIQLIKSMLAVPTKGVLVIKAYLEDAKSGKVIMNNSFKFKSQLSEFSVGTISGIPGEDCCLDLKVDWKYQA